MHISVIFCCVLLVFGHGHCLKIVSSKDLMVQPGVVNALHDANMYTLTREQIYKEKYNTYNYINSPTNYMLQDNISSL